MKQSRWMSLVEAVTNVLVGYGVAVAMLAFIFVSFVDRCDDRIKALPPKKAKHSALNLLIEIHHLR